MLQRKNQMFYIRDCKYICRDTGSIKWESKNR